MKSRINKAYEITDAKIQFVSLVNAAANKHTFLLKKEDNGQAAFTTYGRIIKADAENHYVTGIVYEPMEEDSHGNFMTEAEITKAAYWFAKNGDKVDLQHSFEPLDGAAVVENWIAKADFKIDGITVKKGTWLMTVEVSDKSVWRDIENGDITGFSMGGLGNYSEEDVELDNVNKQEANDKKGLLKQLAKALGIVEKGVVTDLYDSRNKGSLFWNAFRCLEEVLEQYNPITNSLEYETDEEKIRECLDDFNKIITELLTGKESIAKELEAGRPITKAGKKMSGKNRDTLNGIYESLGAFLKEFDDTEEDASDEKRNEAGTDEQGENDKTDKEEKNVTKQEATQIVEDAITKAMGSDKSQSAAKTAQDGAGEIEKAEAERNANEKEITAESVQKMVEAAIEKALEPKKTESETVTAEQVQKMIDDAVQKAVEPVLKSKGLPNNLNGSTVEKSGGDTHYLHGIL